MAVVTDMKVGVDDDVPANNDGIANYYKAEVVAAQDYYPFGWEMPNRSYTNSDYRFGHNGMEKSPELGTGMNTTYFRQLDTRTGRWWSPDPVVHPWQSTYSTFDNNPVYHTDPSGASVGYPSSRGGGKGGTFWRAIGGAIATGLRGIVAGMTTQKSPTTGQFVTANAMAVRSVSPLHVHPTNHIKYRRMMSQLRRSGIMKRNLFLLNSENNLKDSPIDKSHNITQLDAITRDMTGQEHANPDFTRTRGFCTRAPKDKCEDEVSGKGIIEYHIALSYQVGYNFAVGGEEFMHLGQNLFYIKQGMYSITTQGLIITPNTLTIEVEAKILTMISFWETLDHETKSDPDKAYEAFNNAGFTYEKELLFNDDQLSWTIPSGKKGAKGVKFRKDVLNFFKDHSKMGKVNFHEFAKVIDKVYSQTKNWVPNQNLQEMKYLKDMIKAKQDFLNRLNPLSGTVR